MTTKHKRHDTVFCIHPLILYHGDAYAQLEYLQAHQKSSFWIDPGDVSDQGHLALQERHLERNKDKTAPRHHGSGTRTPAVEAFQRRGCFPDLLIPQLNDTHQRLTAVAESMESGFEEPYWGLGITRVASRLQAVSNPEQPPTVECMTLHHPPRTRLPQDV